MPIAAVPAYLGENFKDASPGMRFGMYLTLWGLNFIPENKVSALINATKLNGNDRNLMRSLLERQRHMFKPSESNHCFEATAISPFTTGLGNEHPLENGFAFLSPYGLPYLPGSSIKGVLRQAAQELTSGEWGDTYGWNDIAIEILFGRKVINGDTEHLHGAIVFWDVIPQIQGDNLSVEIMTPHLSHYYQQKSDKKSGDSISPHNSGQPTPISFLTVPPKSRFVFHVQCDMEHLNFYAPEFAQHGKWKVLLESAFNHAYQWLGFGAKTAVGYGAMESEAMRKISEEKKEAFREAEKEAEKQRKRKQTETNAEVWEGARIRYNRSNKSLSVEKNSKNAYAIDPKGQELFNALSAELRYKIETNEYVKVNARVSGTDLLEIII